MHQPAQQPSTSFEDVSFKVTTAKKHVDTLRVRKWAERLENVLNDYDALEQFCAWMGVDDESSEHPIRLHFAILAYRECVTTARDLQKATILASSIYNKFLRPHSGLCGFINASAREAIGRQVDDLKSECSTSNFISSYAQLFSPCEPDLYKFLRHQHTLFCRSKEFLDFYNSALDSSMQTSTSGSSKIAKHSLPVSSYLTNKSFATPNKTNIESVERKNFNNEINFSLHATSGSNRRSKKIPSNDQNPSSSTLKLTATMLYRSQRERESTLGQSQFERMYNAGGAYLNPVNRYPYVGGQATTSKNDSAVSSSFSNDANAAIHHQHNKNSNNEHSYESSRFAQSSFQQQQQPTQPQQQQQVQQHFHQSQKRTVAYHQHKQQRAIREEHRRVNPPAHLPFPRPIADRIPPLENCKSGPSPSAQFNHCSEEGRREFAKILGDKLARVFVERQNDNGAQKCDHNEQKQPKENDDEPTSTLPRREERDVELEFDDEVVNSYYQRSVLLAPGAQDTSTLNSQQQTPPTVSLALPPAEWTNANTNEPERVATKQLQQTQSKQRQRTQRSCSPKQPCMSNLYSETQLRENIMPMTYYLQPKQQQALHHYSLQNAGVMPQSFVAKLSSGGFHFRTFDTNEMTLHSHANNIGTHAHRNQMSQSCSACPQTVSYSTQADNLPELGPQEQQQIRRGFAPPPGKTATQYNEIYYENDCDTSGIGSMTYISDVVPTVRQVNSDAHLARAGTAMTATNAAPPPTAQIPKITKARAAAYRCLRKKAGNGAGGNAADDIVELSANTMEKLHVNEPNSSLSEAQHQQLIVITCRNGLRRKSNEDSVPLVAHVPLNKGITLKEFRKYLSIPLREKKRFFFQTACQDGSAPYQLLMINDNATILPIFEGKITAECCSISDSE